MSFDVAIVGHALRGIIASPMLDHVADVYNQPLVVKLLGSALAGRAVHDRVA